MRKFARDTNPGGSPPPLWDRINALTAAAIFVTSLIVGSSTPNDTLRAWCAGICVVALMVAMYFPMKSLDDARERGEDLE